MAKNAAPAAAGDATDAQPWAKPVHAVLKRAGVAGMAYVPDAGHARLIELFEADHDVDDPVLTTEEEGVAIAAGAWLGGRRGVLLMQSSGVGNCINMLSLPVIGRFPLLMLVTMRGEWAEFNPWQVPMGRATEPALDGDRHPRHACRYARRCRCGTVAGRGAGVRGRQQVAVLISQRLIGAKKW